MKDVIVLDTGSGPSIFSNENMVTNIRPAKYEQIELETNAGTLLVDKKADVVGYGEVWYNNRAITNILGFAEVEDKYPIEYKKGQFTVKTEAKDATFNNEDGIYIFRPTFHKDNKWKQHRKQQRNEISMLSTVKQNETYYTKRQVERAKQARKLIHTLGFPTTVDLKAVVRGNMIKNNPVTIEDINIAEAIYGKDVSSLQGKSTRRKPEVVRSDLIEIPKQLIERNQNIELCIDVMHVNKIPFLVSISKNIMFRTASALANLKSESYYQALDSITRL